MKSLRTLIVVFAILLSLDPVAGQGFGPEEAVRRMKVADGLAVNLVASEPMIRKQIEELRASEISLMPEKILEPLTDQQNCDLLASIQGDGPKEP